MPIQGLCAPVAPARMSTDRYPYSMPILADGLLQAAAPVAAVHQVLAVPAGCINHDEI